MISVESRALAPFLISHNLTNVHCTVLINKNTLTADFMFVDDICTYQLTDNKLVNVFYDRSETPVFSFNVPNIAMFLNESSVLRLSSQSMTVEITCDNPKFSVIIHGDDNHIDPLSYIDAEYISFHDYAPVLKAIKDMKQLSNELSMPIHVELGQTLWTVSISQCCIFGSASGLTGMISSKLFEKIYDWDALVAQTSRTSLTVKRVFDTYSYIIRVPISNTAEMPKVIPNMVKGCSNIICKSQLTNDVSSVIRELAKSIKKEQVQARFSDGRFDVLYDNEYMHLSTIPAGKEKGKYASISVPAKTLTPIVNMIGDITEVSVNGDVLCLMQDKKGLLISGIVSLGH